LGAIFCETKITRVAPELGLGIGFQLAAESAAKIAGMESAGASGKV
jgi:hypothetical protein